MDAITIQPSTQHEEKVITLSPRSQSKDRESVRTISEPEPEGDGGGTPKDIRFWLIILGLLVATFLSALDMTGKIFIC